MIISILILILGFGSLVQFPIAYCRTLQLAYSKVEVFEKAYAMAGITAQEANYDDFDRLIRLAQMAPDPEDDSADIATVRVYYLAMPLLRWAHGAALGRSGEAGGVRAHFLLLFRSCHPSIAV
jgi:hypothetical protein